MFYLLATLLLAATAGVLFARRLVRVVLALMAAVITLAFLYFQLGAEAAGAAQLMVYAGGVLVLLLFGVMIAAGTPSERGPLSHLTQAASGLALAAILLYALAKAFLPALAVAPATAPLAAYAGGTLAGAGRELIAHQAAPFEWAAVLLLLALAFAAPLALRAGKNL